jgi:hypothetical protein
MMAIADCGLRIERPFISMRLEPSAPLPVGRDGDGLRQVEGLQRIAVG